VSTAERYKAAGVDLDAADRAKHRIRDAVAGTYTSLSLGDFGAFGGMVKLPVSVVPQALVLSTDGVGTKVLVAIRAGRHDTVGEDLVNHCVNDILVQGATPLAFLDYIAGATMEADTVAALVEGVARGCRAHEMPLAGGETAQMPDLYHPGHYDLAGTIVGIVSQEEALRADRVVPGDVLVGYASSGLHTNGYTLARTILFEEQGLDVSSSMPGLDMSVGDALLAVHVSYLRALRPALAKTHALAHITGGGIPGNLARSLPAGAGARVDRSAWSVPPMFSVLQEMGAVSDGEMYRVFNMGVGMIAIVSPSDVDQARAHAKAADIETWCVGEIVAGDGVEIVG
jgi:phosphoribosylformylglycinamidine cyclo-ligase